VGSRLEKLENGTYLLRLSKRCHRRSTKPPPVLTRAKRKGTRAGQQFVRQPKAISDKTAKFRRGI
jgi:hypothetical protein